MTSAAKSPGRLARLSRILLPFLSLQAAAQLLTVIAGLVVVRVLPVDDFRNHYALATALQGALSILSDVGVSAVLIARAGPIYGERARLSALVASARKVRRRLEGGVLLLMVPLVWLWLRDKALTFDAILATTAILALTLHYQISSSIYGTVPILLLDVGKAQKTQLAGAAVRLPSVSSGQVSVSHSFLPALAASAAGFAVQATMGRHIASKLVDLQAAESIEDLQAIKSLVKSQMLNALYFAFSTQLTMWVIGLKGAKPAIAGVAALGRLNAVVALAQSALAMLVVPRLARYTNASLFLRRYVEIVVATIAGCLLISAASLAAPGQFLWLLGPSYANLRPRTSARSW